MNRFTTLGHWLRRFLSEHIVTEHSLARNTQLSYRIWTPPRLQPPKFTY